MKTSRSNARTPGSLSFPRLTIGYYGIPKRICSTLYRTSFIDATTTLFKKHTIVILPFQKAYIRDTTHRDLSAIAVDEFM
jgi:hypothetical protein